MAEEREHHKATPGTHLRCIWQVSGGILLNQPMHEYTRSWSLTSEAYEADATTYDLFRDEASAYAKALQTPGLNWVRLDYIWM